MGSGTAPADLTVPLICKFMGWSYDQLMNTPDHIVQDIITWMEKDSQAAKLREMSKK